MPDTKALTVHKQRILIVEDELDVREGMRRMLEFSCDIEEAGTAEEAIARLMQKNEPEINCVVLDMHLPNGAGLALMERFRLAAPSTALVCITGHYFTEEHILRGGADEFLEKPTKPTEMMRAVFNAMARRASHDYLSDIRHQLEKRKAELDQDALEVDRRLDSPPEKHRDPAPLAVTTLPVLPGGTELHGEVTIKVK